MDSTGLGFLKCFGNVLFFYVATHSAFEGTCPKNTNQTGSFKKAL